MIGSNLRNLLHLLRITDDGTCGCKEYAEFLDTKSPEWCEQNIWHIVNRLESSARHQKLPFSRFAAEAIVRLAIHQARKQALKPTLT